MRGSPPVVPGVAISPADQAACREVLRRGSRSFSAAFRLLPRRLQPAVAALYALCRSFDDAVDGAGGSPGLEPLRRRLAALYLGEPEDAPTDRAAAAVIRRCSIPRLILAAFLEGLGWDLEGRRYQDLSELRAYAVRVASTVGLMMALVMGERRRPVLARACDLGVAMQLTNVARDVGEDARAGRLYLPVQELRAAGVDADEWLARPSFSPGLASVAAPIIEEAERLYRRADVGIAMLPEDCRMAIGAARLIYADINRAIRARGLDSVSGRAFTGRGRKLRLLAQACRRCRDGWYSAQVEEPPLREAMFLVEAVGGGSEGEEVARAQGRGL